MKNNIINLLTLLRKDCITVEVTFNESSYSYSEKRYVYKALQRDNLQVGDTVVVLVGSQYKLVTVRKVHARPKLKSTATFEYKWIVQKVDRTQYDRQNAQEQAFGKLLFGAEQKRAANELRETFLTHFGLDSSQAKALIEFLNGDIE